MSVSSEETADQQISGPLTPVSLVQRGYHLPAHPRWQITRRYPAEVPLVIPSGSPGAAGRACVCQRTRRAAAPESASGVAGALPPLGPGSGGFWRTTGRCPAQLVDKKRIWGEKAFAIISLLVYQHSPWCIRGQPALPPVHTWPTVFTRLKPRLHIHTQFSLPCTKKVWISGLGR
jgi:hypothetical protein